MFKTNLASGSSKVSRFSHSVDIILSYLFGYFLKISYTCALIQNLLTTKYTLNISFNNLIIIITYASMASEQVSIRWDNNKIRNYVLYHICST